MARVICDTSFLIHIANTRITNITRLETDIGSLEYVVPKVVISELERLAGDPKKGARARAALDYSKNLTRMDITGGLADGVILEHVRKCGGIVATMDIALKRAVKKAGGSILGIAGDRIILE